LRDVIAPMFLFFVSCFMSKKFLSTKFIDVRF